MYKQLLLVLLSVLGLSACGQGGSGPVGSGAGSGSGATSSETFKWKMVTTWPPNFPVFQEGVERFAADVKAMSGGRLDIQVFAGGELVPPLQTFDAVSHGTVQMGHGAAYYWAGKIPAAQFLSAVPFGMTAKGMHAWLYSGGGIELWQELYEPFGLVPFPLGNTGVQMGGWFNKKIESLEDLKGLKMRIPGLGGKVLAKAGGTPVLMAGGELYTALERGTLDATEWVGPYHDQRLGLYRAAKYYYYPGWHEPGTSLELIVNQKAWKSLPRDLQEIIRIAAMASDLWVFSQFETLNIKALREIKARGTTEVLAFPDEVLSELYRLTQESLAEEAAKSVAFQRVYQKFQDFHNDHKAWNAISDDAYNKVLSNIAAGQGDEGD